MYNFSYFKENDKKAIRDFIDKNPFAFITGSFITGRQVATQIPVLIEEKGGDLFLQGHIMRNTDHHKAFNENPNALIVFTGAHTYVSASWYSQPQIGSTWNYMSVHVHGKMKFMTNAELVSFMKKLTLHFEKGNMQSPTIYDNLPDDFLNKMMPAIVGFEVKADSIENVFKLSQNRDEKSYRNIIAQLELRPGKDNNQLIADEMKNRLPGLFPEGVEWNESKFDS
jgi:transcriptional regulator